MPSPKRALIGAVAAFGALVLAVPAHAVVISFDPLASTVYEGDSFDVGVRVSGLAEPDEILGAFDFNVVFNDAFLLATGFTFGDALGSIDLFESIGDVLVDPNGGLVNLAQVSLLDDSDLADSQGDSILLGLLRLTATHAGASKLGFSAVNLVGRFGASLPVETVGGAATVLARPVSVPEPATLALLAPGLLVLLAQRRRRRQQPKLAPLS